MTVDPGRRRVLLLIGGLAASAVIGPAAIGQFLVRVAPDDARALRDLVSRRESAAALGRTYLRLHHEEADADRLVSLILARGNGAHHLGTHVASRIKADFDAGRVVSLEGWLVSPTEARLYALCALT
jgi:hypothetical protein